MLSIYLNMSKMFLSTLLSGLSAASALEPHAISVNFSPIPPIINTLQSRHFKVKYHLFQFIKTPILVFSGKMPTPSLIDPLQLGPRE